LLAKFFLRKKARSFSYLLYSYFRKIDDFVDSPLNDKKTLTEFINEQKRMVEKFYAGSKTNGRSVIGRVIEYDLKNNCRLKSCIMRMFEVFEFDIERKNKIVSEAQLTGYSRNLSDSYTRLLLYFIEPRYECRQEDVLLAHASHLAHMLRDLKEDKELGYINISQEDMVGYKLQSTDCSDSGFKEWLKVRVQLIKKYFKNAKKTLNKNHLFLIKLTGYLYSSRYETVIRQIEENGYVLKTRYLMRTRDIIRLVKELAVLLLKHLWHNMYFFRTGC